jgi:hypothetical protein
MAVGGAVLLAPLYVRARSRSAQSAALSTAGPWVLALAAMVAGTAMIAPLMYPSAHAEIRKKDAPLRAVAQAHLKHAIVTVKDGEVLAFERDLLQNFPTIADPDVLMLADRGEQELACGRAAFPGRTWYRATGRGETIEIAPR